MRSASLSVAARWVSPLMASTRSDMWPIRATVFTVEGWRARRSAYSAKLPKVHHDSSPSRSSGGMGRVRMRTGERLMPQLPTTTVVTPWEDLQSMHSGPQRTARSSWVWASIKPGATALPVAMISRSAEAEPRSPTPLMRSLVTAISALRRGAPVPSKMVASRMIRSQRSIGPSRVGAVRRVVGHPGRGVSRPGLETGGRGARRRGAVRIGAGGVSRDRLSFVFSGRRIVG